MAKKFAELRSRMTPEAQARAAAQAAALLAMNQPAIAKMEKRADAYISTLRSHIEAMGGELEIIARFPEGSVKITNFSGLDSPTTMLQSEAQDFTATLIASH